MENLNLDTAEKIINFQINKFINNYDNNMSILNDIINQIMTIHPHARPLLIDKLINFALQINNLDLWKYVQDLTHQPVNAHIISNMISTNNIELCKYGFSLFNLEFIYECTWHKIIKLQNIEILQYLLDKAPKHVIYNHMHIYTIERIISTHNMDMLALIIPHMNTDRLNQIIINDMEFIQIIALNCIVYSDNRIHFINFINKLSNKTKNIFSEYYNFFIILETKIAKDIMMNHLLYFL